MIQDKAIELATDRSFAGALGTTHYVFSANAVDLASDQNFLRDVGLGGELVMEFEVTETFTGFVTATPPAQAPAVLPAVAVSDSFPTPIGGDTAILAIAGYTFTNFLDFGLVASDTTGFGNLFKGDRFYVPIPGLVRGLPWVGAGTRNNNIIPSRRYLYACWIVPHHTGVAAGMLNASLYAQANFTAGKMSARVLLHQPLVDGVHHYAAGMKVR